MLKRFYSREIDVFIKAHINHITKVEFLIAFHAAYLATITEKNIKAGFRGAGLIPFDPQAVVSKQDVRLRTPSPSRPSSVNTDPWVSQTTHNPREALSQSTLVKNRIAHHQGSSPTSIFQTVNLLANGKEMLAHENTLLSAEIRTLRKANETLSKHRRAKKTLIRQGGVLTLREGNDILAQQEVDEQIRRDKRSWRGNRREGQSIGRRCSTCGNTGHNARTCQNDVIDSKLLESR